jgi:hypothetical protein
VKHSLRSRSRQVLGTSGDAGKKRGKQARWLQGYGRGETFNGKCSARDNFLQDYCARMKAEDAAPPKQP